MRVFLVVVWLLLLGNTAGMDQKDSITVVMAAAYAGLGLLVSLLALFFLRRCQALMPCIMAGMDQISSYVVFDQGHLLPCRGAEAIPMVGIPQLPHIWSIPLLCSSAFLSWRIPRLQFSDTVVTCPLL